VYNRRLRHHHVQKVLIEANAESWNSPLAASAEGSGLRALRSHRTLTRSDDWCREQCRENLPRADFHGTPQVVVCEGVVDQAAANIIQRP
jgi:hypothetical protein